MFKYENKNIHSNILRSQASGHCNLYSQQLSASAENQHPSAFARSLQPSEPPSRAEEIPGQQGDSLARYLQTRQNAQRMRGEEDETHMPSTAQPLSVDQNRTLAERAFYNVRSNFKAGLKSANKKRTGDLQSEMRQNEAWPVVYNLQQEIYRHFPVDYSRVLAEAAGNCQEMAGAAARLVRLNGGFAQLYCVDDKGSHAFCLVGQPPMTASDAVNFSDYAGYWVVDPWAGIICPAGHYTMQFHAKMHKWRSVNKQILDHGQWIHADNEEWLNAVISGIKTPFAGI